MSRKRFIESQGASCQNWSWSWSFISESKKIIIFGAWDDEGNNELVRIFSDTWQFDEKGRKKAAYDQSMEHIRLIEREGYALKTFPIFQSDKDSDRNERGSAKIGKFIPELHDKYLVKIDTEYYAASYSEANNIAEEIFKAERYFEGASKSVTINAYERNTKAREKCLEHFGYECQICSFNFEKVYGAIGKNYIHVHHIIPLSQINENYEVDPYKDLIPICPNCHSIIHRTKIPLSIEDLKDSIRKTNSRRT